MRGGRCRSNEGYNNAVSTPCRAVLTVRIGLSRQKARRWPQGRGGGVNKEREKKGENERKRRLDLRSLCVPFDYYYYGVPTADIRGVSAAGLRNPAGSPPPVQRATTPSIIRRAAPPQK